MDYLFPWMMVTFMSILILECSFIISLPEQNGGWDIGDPAIGDVVEMVVLKRRGFISNQF